MSRNLAGNRTLFVIVASEDPVNELDLETQQVTWLCNARRDSQVVILRGHNSSDFVFDGETLFVPCRESYQNILLKTLLGFSWILKNLEFELAIRTNVSTYYNLAKLSRTISGFRPEILEFGGFQERSNFEMGADEKNQTFVTGTGIYLTHASVRELVTMSPHDYFGMPDDLAISRFLLGRGAEMRSLPRVNLHSTHMLFSGFQTRLKSSEVSDLASKRMIALFSFYSKPDVIGKFVSYLKLCSIELSNIHYDLSHLKYYLIRNYYILRLNLKRKFSEPGHDI